jgi:hypothetical protein
VTYVIKSVWNKVVKKGNLVLIIVNW